MTPGDGDPRHGTPNGYNNLGCHCRPCTNAIRDYRRERNHRTGRKRPRDVYLAAVRAQAEARDNHGTECRYNNLKCRCDLCRTASAAARRRRRHNAKVTA